MLSMFMNTCISLDMNGAYGIPTNLSEDERRRPDPTGKAKYFNQRRHGINACNFRSRSQSPPHIISPR